MAVATFVLTLAAGCSQAGGAGAMAAMADPYARPGALTKLPDGRQMNLRCSGEGSPTVVLEAGFGSGSQAWVKVQPQLSRTTRVCSYDRAGYGFSDAGPMPRDAAAVARDLDQALTAAGVRGPLIVVGHSAGGMYGRVFAARRPREVAGLVLLDPTVEHRVPQPVGDGLDGLRARVRRCLAAAGTAPRPPMDGLEWSGCLPQRPSPHDLEHAGLPSSWQTQLSELDELFGRSSDQVLRAQGQLAEIPTYVITASATASQTPNYGLDGKTQLEIQHMVIAGVSRQGYQRTITSSHLVMIDRPEVVIAAVGELIDAVRAGRPPAPLPPSEGPALPDTNILKELFANPRGLLAPPGPPPPPAHEQN